ncbi:PQ-loop-domain-containing protein, partial [Thozetella sp. PMI_491]
ATMQPPSTGEALSGVFGSISLTAWICLLLPQLIANYKAKNADGLSMGFLFIWLLGDVTNLSGALWADLAPTAIALASYFCFADLVLISQCLYYNALNARRRARSHNQRRRRHASAGTQGTMDSDTTAVSEATEDEPLLQRSDSAGLPGSHRRHSVRRSESNLDPLTRIITGEDDTPDSNPWLHNTLSLAAVWLVGATGWFISYKMGAWSAEDSVPSDEPDSSEPTAVIGVILGYASAVCYLCARVPQILKNYREKSCEGLALLFFLLSLTGNSTYGASLVSYSQKPEYLVKTIPWLLGSLGTIVEDLIIFVQFRLYAPDRKVTATHSA